MTNNDDIVDTTTSAGFAPDGAQPARLRRSPSLVAGAAIISLLFGVAVVAVFWTPHDPLMLQPDAAFLSPSLRYLLGTDQLGRDILSNVLSGAGTTLLAALLATIIAMTMGVCLGVAAAVSRRWMDDAILAIATVFVALPALLLALVVVAARGPSTATVVITVGIAAGASVTVVTRREAAGVMRQPFIAAARYSGSTTWAITKRHVARNLVPTLVVQATGAASIAIVAESTLSYLGLGTTPPTPSWGRMIASTQQYLLVHPLLTLWPALCICIAVLGLTLLGDGLREQLDPTVSP